MTICLPPILGCAKSLQIVDTDKITSLPPILIANVQPIPIDAIGSIVRPNQVLLKLYKLFITLMIVFLSEI